MTGTTGPTNPQPSTDPKHRVIVLSFDGTGNMFDETNTNIVKFHGLLDKNCPLEQIVYYQAGVGTFFNPGVVSPLMTWFAKIADVAFAWYINEHVKAGYRFLMQNYRAGDKVCIFGFSRGAHTARALAGFLCKIGLLPRDNEDQVTFAYDLYKRDDKEDLAEGFKRTFCTPVEIDFLGVWDTVASIGLIYGRDLPFTSANSAVRVFRHALSLDERRARFQPHMFRIETPDDVAKRKGKQKPTSPVSVVAAPRSPESSGATNPHTHPGFGYMVRRHSSQDQGRISAIDGRTPRDSKVLDPERKEPSTTSSTLSRKSEPFPAVQEVWFAGCHSDVGGGAVEDKIRYSLGDISLRWMVKQVLLSGCEIKFDDAALERADINVSKFDVVGPTQQTAERVWSRECEFDVEIAPSTSGEDGSEEGLIYRGKGKDGKALFWPREEDVLADHHDELDFNLCNLPMWLLYKFLEVFPVTFTWQDDDGQDKSKRRWNLGRGREWRSKKPPKFHESVRQRMRVDPEYKPQLEWTKGTEIYVH